MNKQRQPHQVDTETVAMNHQRLRSAQLDPPIVGVLVYRLSSPVTSDYHHILCFYIFTWHLVSTEYALYSVNKALRLPCLSPETVCVWCLCVVCAACVCVWCVYACGYGVCAWMSAFVCGVCVCACMCVHMYGVCVVCVVWCVYGVSMCGCVCVCVDVCVSVWMCVAHHVCGRQVYMNSNVCRCMCASKPHIWASILAWQSVQYGYRYSMAVSVIWNQRDTAPRVRDVRHMTAMLYYNRQLWLPTSTSRRVSSVFTQAVQYIP